MCYHTVDTGEGTPYDGPWVKDVLPEEVIDTYEGWEPNLVLLLKANFYLCTHILSHNN